MISSAFMAGVSFRHETRYLTLFTGTQYSTIPTYTTVAGTTIEDTFAITDDTASNVSDFMARAVGGALTVPSGSLDAATAPADGRQITRTWSGMTAGTTVSVIMANNSNTSNATGFFMGRRIFESGTLVHDYQLDTNTGTFVDKVNPANTGTITGTVEYYLVRRIGSDWVVTNVLPFNITTSSPIVTVTGPYSFDYVGAAASSDFVSTLPSSTLFVGQHIRMMFDAVVNDGSLNGPIGSSYDPSPAFTTSGSGSYVVNTMLTSIPTAYNIRTSTFPDDVDISVSNIRFKHIIPIA